MPHEAQWGSSVLLPGDYSFTLDSASAGGIVKARNEETGRHVGMIMTNAQDTKTASNQSALILVRRGGKSYVRSLELKELGQTFYFILPKPEKQIIAEGPVLYQRVPVVVNGK